MRIAIKPNGGEVNVHYHNQGHRMTYRQPLGVYHRKRHVPFETRRWPTKAGYIETQGHWVGWTSPDAIRLTFRQYWCTNGQHRCGPYSEW